MYFSCVSAASYVILPLNSDDFVKSLQLSFSVIHTKAGIQCFQTLLYACLCRNDWVLGFLIARQCCAPNKFLCQSDWNCEHGYRITAWMKMITIQL